MSKQEINVHEKRLLSTQEFNVYEKRLVSMRELSVLSLLCPCEALNVRSNKVYSCLIGINKVVKMDRSLGMQYEWQRL